uniref:Cerebellar degeneration-related protein 2-like n=1 Tax=Neogobius melanostomus TaxID=47308 RepID=A0A8C6UXR4_9GOBI
MLAEMIVEEEFEIKEDEPWYDKQDLEHDLQLAAELGKSLLERNRELEQGLGQMYSTNQEQMQEIEYLTKQVDLLRQVNDQHAKVYEQLDSSARELEQTNRKLSQDNRGAQQKIQGLTETVEVLQTQLEELQQQVEDMKISSSLKQAGRPRGRQSISCLKELDNTYRLNFRPSDAPDTLPSPWCWHEEEKESLRESLQSLQTQFASERSRRECAERDTQVLVNENAALERQLSAMEGCKTRLTELERESEELRQLWKHQSTSRSALNFLHDSDEIDSVSPKNPRLLKRWDSDRAIVKPAPFPESPDDGHACTCIRRHDAFKYRGISLLNEVDAQYSALQVKYDELLRRCHQGTPQEGEEERDEVQTPSRASSVDFDQFTEDMHQPEYKELFREIFQRIQKTKEDLNENRGRAMNGDVVPVF